MGQGHEKYFLLTEIGLQRTRVQGKHTAGILKLVCLRQTLYLKGGLKQIPLEMLKIWDVQSESEIDQCL